MVTQFHAPFKKIVSCIFKKRKPQITRSRKVRCFLAEWFCLENATNSSKLKVTHKPASDSLDGETLKRTIESRWIGLGQNGLQG